MPNFELSRYLIATRPDEQRNPADTVMEYVSAYQKWARDCHTWAKANRNRVEELQQGEARNALDSIQKKYCSSKNRQYWRASAGYYFYGGTYDVYPVISSQEPTSKHSFTVITEKHKPHSPSFRFLLEKHGKVWLIASIERLNGTGQWELDVL